MVPRLPTEVVPHKITGFFAQILKPETGSALPKDPSSGETQMTKQRIHRWLPPSKCHKHREWISNSTLFEYFG
jgi:hypothetical protein